MQESSSLKRNSRLFYLALSVFLPPLGIMLIGVSGIFFSQKNLENLARAYVENLTEITAVKIERGEDIFFPGDNDINVYFEGGLSALPYQLVGLMHLPSMIVVLDRDGSFLYGSSRLRDLIRSFGAPFPLRLAREIHDADGDKFTVCTFPSSQGHFFVVGAVSWNDLPGGTIKSLYFWPIIIGLIGLWGALAVWRLWLRVIRPLWELEAEISGLKWGEEPLKKISMYETIGELKKLRETLTDVAEDAMQRVTMIKSCMNDIVGVQEAERATISRDIHDGPLQDVTALIQRIHLAKSPDNTREEIMTELDLAEKIAMSTVKDMRGLCDFLNPPWLELGLAEALTELTERLSAQYSVKVFLDIDEAFEFSDSLTPPFFRVVQESVTNSVRHGGAGNIWVTVEVTDMGVELTVADDGNGFDMHLKGTAGLRVAGHRGLSNMEERMALVGGRLEIISLPGEGTCIKAIAPFS